MEPLYIPEVLLAVAGTKLKPPGKYPSNTAPKDFFSAVLNLFNAVVNEGGDDIFIYGISSVGLLTVSSVPSDVIVKSCKQPLDDLIPHFSPGGVHSFPNLAPQGKPVQSHVVQKPCEQNLSVSHFSPHASSTHSLLSLQI
jgi:hypothetical protein